MDHEDGVKLQSMCPKDVAITEMLHILVFGSEAPNRPYLGVQQQKEDKEMWYMYTHWIFLSCEEQSCVVYRKMDATGDNNVN